MKEKQRNIRETQPVSVTPGAKNKINEVKLWFNGALTECIKEGYVYIIIFLLLYLANTKDGGE